MTVFSGLAGAPVAATIMAAVSVGELVTMLTTVVVEDPVDSFGLRGVVDEVEGGAADEEG